MSTNNAYDLLVRAGKIFCTVAGLDGPGAIAIRGDRIVKAGANVDGPAKRTLDFPNDLLLPGLIDLHAHPARSGSVFGVDPDRFMLGRGVTTVMSQGDAGADNVSAYIRETIHRSKTRVLLALNLSRIGESTADGCFHNIENADVDACVTAVGEHRAHIWGIAVNASHHACGDSDPHEVLDRGLTAAGETGLPMLYGMRRPSDWPLEQQLPLLRPGDVVTYCFRSQPHCIVQNSRVLPAVRDARARGVLFDVGHGIASFDFTVARAALDDGFPPETISTDLQRRHIGQSPTHDLPLVLSKLHAAGMPQGDVFAAVTCTPAKVLRLHHEIGSLTSGSCADLTVVVRSDAPVELADSHGQQQCTLLWQPLITVRDGEVIPVPGDPPQ